MSAITSFLNNPVTNAAATSSVSSGAGSMLLGSAFEKTTDRFFAISVQSFVNQLITQIMSAE